ncbi:MAG TPA: alanine--tRNA ligase, partial [Burkholderiaceae bacterium]|nr:alanine--tRNA ligase [Burkholderiaceae bacterium]
DTHGFPVDLTADIARERGFTVDMAGFERAMERQREMARAEARFRASAGLEYEGARTRFVGYERLRAESWVVALYADGVPVPSLRAGQSGVVVLDTTPFYAEGGGQVGDRGELAGAHGTFRVDDTQKIQAEVFGHQGTLATGTLSVGEVVEARVDGEQRARTMLNHSATHLMHAALREVLGAHVQQKGSRVDAERTRFDFSHDKPMTPEEVRRVEAIVNRAIRANVAVSANVMKFDDAIRSGALAFFGDKYGDEVRVIAMGGNGENVSTELCGGTHVRRTGDIGFFKVVAETGIASGVRRIEAVTGVGALDYVQWLDGELSSIATTVRTPLAEVDQRIGQILEEVKAQDKEIARLKSRLAVGQGDELATRAVEVKSGLKVLAATLDGADARTLRETLDRLKNKLKSAAIVLASVEDGKVQIAAGVTQDAVGRIKAGELANFVASQVGGKGGGRPDLAMAGGNDPTRLSSALSQVQAWVSERL